MRIFKQNIQSELDLSIVCRKPTDSTQRVNLMGAAGSHYLILNGQLIEYKNFALCAEKSWGDSHKFLRICIFVLRVVNKFYLKLIPKV